MNALWEDALTALGAQGGRRFWRGLGELAGSRPTPTASAA